MKNLLLGLLTLTVIGVSCSKNQVVIEPVTETTVKKTRKQKTKINSTKCPNGPCHEPVLNCATLPVVVIKPSQVLMMDEAGQNGPSYVGQLFTSSDFQFIIDELDSELVDKLQSGEYTIRKNYETESKVNYLVGSILPLTYTNSEFVLEINK